LYLIVYSYILLMAVMTILPYKGFTAFNESKKF